MWCQCGCGVISMIVCQIYHTFHREVNSYRQHWWRCNGACRSRPPFYGYVKRSMNRAPSKQDFWWEEHAKTCGGRYTKIKEPDGYGVKKKKRELHGKRTTAILHRTGVVHFICAWLRNILCRKTNRMSTFSPMLIGIHLPGVIFCLILIILFV